MRTPRCESARVETMAGAPVEFDTDMLALQDLPSTAGRVVEDQALRGRGQA